MSAVDVNFCVSLSYTAADAEIGCVAMSFSRIEAIETQQIPRVFEGCRVGTPWTCNAKTKDARVYQLWNGRFFAKLRSEDSSSEIAILTENKLFLHCHKPLPRSVLKTHLSHA